MKRGTLIVVVLTMLVASAVVAQEKSADLTRAQIQAERKAIVEATVAPAGQQTEPFWQTYWEYRGAVGVLNDRTIEVIEEFQAAEGALTGDRSAALVLEVLDIEKRRAALKQKWVKRFQDILVPKQVTRWYQTEGKMDSVFRADMALMIPFNKLTAKPDQELTETAIRNSREELVNLIVQPSAEQEKPFWYEYRRYTKKVDDMDDRITALVDEYTKSYASLNDQQAERMTKQATAIGVDRAKELEKLVYSLKSVLTGKQMARLVQGELKMNAVIDLVLAATIPFDR